MAKIIFSALLTLAAIAAHSAVPVRWSTDCYKVKPLAYECYHGETLDLAAALTAYGEPLDLSGKTATLYWQTNGMASAWWSTNAFVRADGGVTNVLAALWSGAYDTGAPSVTGFIGVEGEIYRAAFELKFRASPGFEPSSLPLPVATIDCEKVTFLHPEAAPFGGGGGGASTNVVNDLIASYDATNLAPRIDAKATSNALAAVAWSGAYGDLSGRPTIPEVPSGVVVTNENGWATGLKIKADGADAGVWLNNGYFNIGANGMAAIELPMYAGIGVTFSDDVNIGAALTVANQIYANGGISAPAPISATALATVNRDDWSGYTYDGDSSHNLQSALDAKANASSLAAVATSGSYGDLSNKPTIPTDEGITNAATAVFADCADYILTNAATSAAFTIRSGEIAQTAISGTTLDLTLDFSTAANRSGDCLVYAVCAQDATLAILPSASVAPLGTDWTALKAGTNIVCVMRLAYDGAKSVVAVAVKEVK